MTEIGLETHYVLYCRVSVVKDVHEKCQQDRKRYETKKTISQPLFLESVLLYFVLFQILCLIWKSKSNDWFQYDENFGL